NLLPLGLPEDVTRYRTRRHVRIERLVESVLCEIRGLVDRVRLADRIVNDAPLAGDLIYGQLHRRRQRSTNEINFVGLDQLERTRRRLTRIEFIVTHNELGLARRF